MKNILFLFFCFSVLVGNAQNKDSLDLSKFALYKVDTLGVELEEVWLLPKLTFKSYTEKRYYYWFRKKVLRAYPYAKLASNKLEELNGRLDSISSKRKKKKLIKSEHKSMEEAFSEELKKMTRTEGRILIKLIHRQTGVVTYDLVKGLRSGWNAFWYNVTANFFDLSLKMEYDPVNNQEDYLIEDILQRAWQNNLIDLEESKLDFSLVGFDRYFEFGPPKD